MVIKKFSTVKDVAQKAGVSVGTVSKALNGTGHLSPETIAYVKQIAHQLGYRPNRLAAALPTGRTGTVGLISNDRFGRFIMPIVEGLEAVFAAKDIGLFICNAQGDIELEQKHLDQLLRHQVDGLIFASKSIHTGMRLKKSDIPVPYIHVFSKPIDRRDPHVHPDDFEGTKQAVLYLAEQGRKRIVYLMGPAKSTAAYLRRDGYLNAMKQKNLPIRHDWVIQGEWSEQWGRQACIDVMHKDPTIDAFVCGSDQIARGVLDSLRAQKICVPQDVAVIGFDNWDVMVQACQPLLSSVDMNLTEMGVQTAKILLEMMGGTIYQGKIIHPSRLVIRESCSLSLKNNDK